MTPINNTNLYMYSYYGYLEGDVVLVSKCDPTIGQNLTHSLLHHFENDPNSTKMQTTNEMWPSKDFKIQIA